MHGFALLGRPLGKEWCPPPSVVASLSFQEVAFEIFPVLRSLKESHQILLNLLINMENRVEFFFFNKLSAVGGGKGKKTNKPSNKINFFNRVTMSKSLLMAYCKNNPVCYSFMCKWEKNPTHILLLNWGYSVCNHWGAMKWNSIRSRPFRSSRADARRRQFLAERQVKWKKKWLQLSYQKIYFVSLTQLPHPNNHYNGQG